MKSSRNLDLSELRKRLVPRETLEFGLAGIIKQEFFIPAEALPALWASVFDHIEKHGAPRDFCGRKIQGTTPEEFLDETLIDLKDDLHDNIVGIRPPADGFPVTFLEIIAPWVRDGSYLVLEDDEGRIWEIRYVDGEVRFLGPAPRRARARRR